jgi:alpha-tubulin suppressor-like RCC1 family protein
MKIAHFSGGGSPLDVGRAAAARSHRAGRHPIVWPRPVLSLALALTATGLGACQLGEEDPFDVRSTSSALTLENGLEVNGVSGNGLYVNGLSFNSAVANGLYVNGLPLNGLPLNGLYVNGLYVNGIGTNGLPLNGLPLNGLYVNGLPFNGLPLNGLPLNGLYVNGLPLNGLYVNGLATNGVSLNGLPLNGLYVNGLPFNGLYVNGLYANGLYVNGLTIDGLGLNGLAVNGLSAATAIKIASPTGQLVNLTASEEAGFESAMGHLTWCALPEGQSLSIYRSTGVAKVYPGRHGLAPTWKTAGLVSSPTAVDDSEELRWCMEHYRPVNGQNAVYPGLALNSQQQADLQMVLKYAISCALDATDSVSVQFPSGSVSFSGGLGLAPEWKTGAMGTSSQQAVSACLAARTNALGNTVRISLRGPFAGLATSAVERAHFKGHEGAFWGNVFGSAPSLHACAVDGGGPSGRVCTDGSCGFQMSPSACSAACDTRDGDGNWTSCGAGNEPVVLNTFLMTETSLASGNLHTCARRSDDSIWCWGMNHLGQQGDGTTLDFGDFRLAPRAVVGLPAPVDASQAARQIETGSDYTCSRHRDGRMWCWGTNGSGELGVGTQDQHNTPVQVAALGNQVASFSLGSGSSCAVKMDGTLWCWGNNTNGQLGDGTYSQRLSPVPITALGNLVLDVSVSSGHTCAVKMDGTLWCWGDGKALGTGTEIGRSTPAQVTALGDQVISVVGGWNFGCALKRDGTAWCWGENMGAGVGDGTTATRWSPVQITTLGNQVVSLAAGMGHACAAKLDGTLWCWGNNDNGQIGDGTVTRRLVPVRVTLPAPVRSLTAAQSVSTFAILTDGSVWGWGSNWTGTLGDLTSIDRTRPARMTALLLPGNGKCDFSESSTYEPIDCPVSPPEATCTDQIDNDVDGAADCSDTDCALNPSYRCGQLCGTECDAGCPAALSCSGLSCGLANACGVACGSSCDAGCGSASNGVKDCSETGIDCGGSAAACASAQVTLFSEDFAVANTSTLAPKWTELPTGTAGKWDVAGTTGGVAGYPYATTGARTGHAVACTATAGCSLTMATAVNLSGKSSATLTFWRFVRSSLDKGEYLKVEVTNGSSWVTVKNWTNGAGDDSTWRKETIDLTSYLKAGFKVRFVTKQNATDEHVHIDDVTIVAQ